MKKYTPEEIQAFRDEQKRAYEGTAIDKLKWELKNHEMGIFRPSSFYEWEEGPEIARKLLDEITLLTATNFQRLKRKHKLTYQK